MSMKDKMHTGELYLPGDKEILAEQEICLEKLYEFNMTRPSEGDKRKKMLSEMFAEIGENCYIEPPFHANWGGRHVHFGILMNRKIRLRNQADFLCVHLCGLILQPRGGLSQTIIRHREGCRGNDLTEIFGQRPAPELDVKLPFVFPFRNFNTDGFYKKTGKTFAAVPGIFVFPE